MTQNHSLVTKKGIVKTLLEHLQLYGRKTSGLVNSGYREKLIQDMLDKLGPTQNIREEISSNILIIPYQKGLSRSLDTKWNTESQRKGWEVGQNMLGVSTTA